MQIGSLEFQLDDSILTQRVLRLRIGAQDVRIFIDRVAEKIRPKVSVPGFRSGKGPRALVRKHYRGRINQEAFEELKRVALEQVLKELRDEDKPFLPPEVMEREKVRVRYGAPLEFALRYLVDPSGIGKQPEADHQSFDPLGGLHEQPHRGSRPIGIPGGPALPKAPTSAGSDQIPKVG